MKRLLAVAMTAVVGFSFAKAVPVDTSKQRDPYDDDLLKAKKPIQDVLRGDISERRQAADRLLKLASETHQLVVALNLALQSPDEVVRIKAAKALQEVGPSAHLAIPNLVKALQDSNEDVRAETANA